jgi:hypothetical protein
MSNKINKENYDLLIRVLCSNLAYNLKIKTPNGIEKLVAVAPLYNKVMSLSDDGEIQIYQINSIKPILKSCKNMTDEELEVAYTQIPVIGEDWLDKIHFDFRKNSDGKTLIDLGLALECSQTY